MLRSGRERDSGQHRPYESPIDIDVDVWTAIGQPLTSDLAEDRDGERDVWKRQTQDKLFPFFRTAV